MDHESYQRAWEVILNHTVPAKIGSVQHGTPRNRGVGIGSFESYRCKNYESSHVRSSSPFYGRRWVMCKIGRKNVISRGNECG